MLCPAPLGLGAIQLMSKELNGPPGSPVLLCSGTAMTSMTAYGPPWVVPHVGQFATFPQPLRIKNIAATMTVNRILVLIVFPPAISLSDGGEPPRQVPNSLNVPLDRSGQALESELHPLRHHKVVLR